MAGDQRAKLDVECWRSPVLGRVGRTALLVFAGVLLAVSPRLAFAQSSTDWGDAPTNNYPTLLIQNGARHTATGPALGTARDTENNGFPHPNALGDDTIPSGGTDDEDGVTFLTLLVPGQVARVQVVASGTGLLNAWLDFNDDGDWNDAGDRLFTNVGLVAGANILTFTVPAVAVQGITFARFRLATAFVDTPTGAAQNGEVEDYQVQISAQQDFGDAPTNTQTNNYPTLLSQNGARHTLLANFFLGIRVDSEPDGQPNAIATGDDVNPTTADDEEGVTFGAIVAGQVAGVQVACTMAAGQTGRIDAWMDWNRDGDWADAGEKIFTDQPVVNGLNTLNFNVPGSASGGQTFTRFRLSRNGKLNFVGAAPDGEVEDYQVSVTAALDFGDAPTNYPTLLAQNGARHNFDRSFCLGATVDGEVNGQPSVDAKGDDTNDLDDEDGVNFASGITPGQSAAVQVFVTLPPGLNGAILNAWMDFNRDGDWADVGEQIFADVGVVGGFNSLSFAVPATASGGVTFTRFRLSTARSIGFLGLVTDGEVEDYQVNISPEFDFGDAPKPYPTLLAENGARHDFVRSIHLGPAIDSEPDGQPDLTATGDDLNPPNLDDEDGVVFTSPLVPGSLASLQVSASVPGLLHAWIDFNGNGTWADVGERIFSGQGLAPGVNNLQFTVPANARFGLTFARFRFTQQTAILDFVGPGPAGEVEDYRVSVIPDRERCDLDCEGREYWLTFPGNYDPDPDNRVQLNLCIHGAAGTTVNVSVPGLGFSTNVIVPAAGPARVFLPTAADLGDLNDAVTNLGIHVIASTPVGITAFNHADFTTDSYQALHTSVIGTEYIILGYQNVHVGVPPLNGTQFAIVGAESNTVVTITPSVTTGARAGGVPYNIALQPGDTYQLRNTGDAPNDLSGTFIKSDKPVAVFGSHQHTVIPALTNEFYSDHLVEQLLSVNTWGNDFYTAPLATRTGGDTFRVLAGHDNTTILLNGAFLANLNRGKFHEMLLTAGTHITADRPIFVAQYANSGDFDSPVINSNADPFMLTIQATRHWANAYRICTPTNDFPTNYISIVAPTSYIASILVDGAAIPGGFTTIPTTTFGFKRAVVAPGSHVVAGPGLFGLSIYGWAEYDSYGHPGCFFLGDVAPPHVGSPTTGVTANVNDYPNTPGFVPSPNLASASTVQDNCDQEPRTPDQEPKPGTLVPPGVHTISLSIVDLSGNIGTTNVSFTVLDPSPVVIECPSNRVVNCTGPNGAIVNFQVTAHTTYDPNVPVVSTPPSGSVFPVGMTEVKSTATSLAGQSNSCSFFVTVNCQIQGGITLAIGANGLSLNWSGSAGTLESAPTLTGPWRIVVTGVNSYAAPISTRSNAFFRVRH